MPQKRATGSCPQCKKVVPCSRPLRPGIIAFLIFAAIMYIGGDIGVAGWIAGIIGGILAFFSGYKCDFCGSRVKNVREK